MSNGNASFDPDLTPAGIGRLITQLQGDLVAVNGVTANQSIKDKVGQLTGELIAALEQAQIDPNLDVSTWVTGIQQTFSNYIDELKLTFPYLSRPPQTGACSYRNGCIQATQAQCSVLGGIFYPGEPCP